MIATARYSAWETTAVFAVTEARAVPDARNVVEGILDEVDRACSRFRPDSELARANAHAGTRVAVSELLADLVATGLEAAGETDGVVDPTLGAELRAAGYDRTFPLVRARAGWTQRRVARDRASWRDVELDREALTLTVPRGLELDLGATAKAWAADTAARKIAAELGTGVLVSLGGDIAVRGPSPPEGWAVRITDHSAAPLDAPGPVVAVAEGGLATSSTAVRRWSTDRGDAHHVIDPRTGLPAVTPWRTVTVAAASCVDANVASTAAVVLGPDAPGWLERRGLPARLVHDDDTVTLTGGWPE